MLQAASPAVSTKPTASQLEVPRRLFCHDQDLQDVLAAEELVPGAPAEASDDEDREPEQASDEGEGDSAGSGALDDSLAGTSAVNLLTQYTVPQCRLRMQLAIMGWM